MRTLCDDIFRDDEQLYRRSIYVAYGCLWTLACLCRDMGDRPRDHEYRIHRRWCDRRSIWARVQSCEVPPDSQSYRMEYLYSLPSRPVYMVCRSGLLSLDDYRTDRRSLRADGITKSCPSRETRKSIWIRTITRKYRFTTHRIYGRTTHAVSRDTVAREFWRDWDIWWMVGYDSRSRDGYHICPRRNCRTHRDAHSISHTELSCTLGELSDSIMRSSVRSPRSMEVSMSIFSMNATPIHSSESQRCTSLPTTSIRHHEDMSTGSLRWRRNSKKVWNSPRRKGVFKPTAVKVKY